MARIGIFWVYQGRVLGRARPLVEGEESVPGLLDSPDTHARLWEEEGGVCGVCPELAGREYFTIPRGRVLWDRQAEQAVVYLDRTLLQEGIKRSIMTFFGLSARRVRWRSDLHYTTEAGTLARLFEGEDW